MVSLSMIHYIFLFMTALILIALLAKKEIVVPCIAGILLIGFAYTKNVISSIQILSTSLVASDIELFSVILVIALVYAMSKAMQTTGADVYLIRPVRKLIHRPVSAFLGIGACMFIVSWLIWPSPAVALIGALLLPVTTAAGLPAIWSAVSMNIFGHGVGLSSDFFIQGAPAITAKGAGLNVTDVMSASLPLWLIMSSTVILITFIRMLHSLRKSGSNTTAGPVSKIDASTKSSATITCSHTMTAILSWLIVISFGCVIAAMLHFQIIGSDATALVAGTALLLTCILSFAGCGPAKGLEEIVIFVKDGFIFSIQIFAPVIVIAAFFFLGSHDFACKVLGPDAPSILSDISLYLSAHVPMNKGMIILIELFIGFLTGLDGSGFSGLPLVGSVATTFAQTTGLNAATLAALGQITTIWVGGGTIIPWAVVPVAAICNVPPAKLAAKNLIPVLIGLAVTCIAAFFLL